MNKLWSTRFLTWAVQVTLDYPKRLRGKLSNVRKDVQDAFDQWERAGVFEFAEAEVGNADIIIKWANEGPDGKEFTSADTIAFSYYPWTMNKGTVILDPSEPWTTGWAIYSYLVREVVAHELGHVFGLQHSGGGETIMRGNWHLQAKSVQPNDLARLQNLYQDQF